MAKLQELVGLLNYYYREFVEALRDYERGEERVYAVERLAQLIIQVILDFAAMLAARERGSKPDTYRELARWLGRRLGLEKDMVEFLEGLAGFRNVLVHMYATINEELERRAFHEMVEKVPVIARRLEEAASDDVCLDDVAPRIRELARRLGLRYVLVFGSLARSGCGRDVDLAVKLGRRPESMLEVGRLQLVFEDELRVPVDLVVLDVEVSPALAKTIVDEAVLVYGDQEEAMNDLLRLYKQYLDSVEAWKLWRRGSG